MISLPEGAPMSAYQQYVHQLEEHHGWLDADLVQNCFLMGEEVGEVFGAVRRIQRADARGAAPEERAELAAAVGEEIVDVMNFLLAIANRLDIDVEAAFRAKNARNQQRTW